MASAGSSRSIIGTFLVTNVLFTLSTSIIWGVNTLFLLHAGLTIFQVFLVNAAFTVGDLVFQVPTGVIADTLGRKVSFLLSLATLVLSTLAYLGAAMYGWGVWAFAGASVFIGLGFTFYSGAIEAWLVDELNRVGYAGTREQVFAWGGMAFSGSMVLGSLAGGFLGQIDLSLPYLARAGALALTFVLAAVFMREVRAERPPLTFGAFAQQGRRVLIEGVTTGWANPVCRPLLLASGIQGLFFIFGFYSWQRFFLDMLGTEAVWLTGVIAALFGCSGILGNALVGRITKGGTREPTRILAGITIAQAVLVGVIGAIGLLTPASARGWGPFAAVCSLYVVFGVLFGAFRPIRQAFLNPYLPSEQRATILSLDALMNDAGGTVGQVGLGWMSQALSIPAAWLLSGFVLAVGYPFYGQAGRGAEAMGAAAAEE